MRRLQLAQVFQNFDRHFRDELQTELMRIGSQAQAHYNRVVGTWENKPTFTVQVVEQRNVIQLYVRAQGESARIWYFVDEGTGQYVEGGSPYTIRAVFAPKLAFRGGYNAKTAPIARYNVGDGSSSGSFVQVDEVIHPGIRGRKFADTYFKEGIDLQDILTIVFRKAIRRS